METYIFHRGTHWYPVELRNDNEAFACIPINPGTTKVETIDGRVLWPIANTPSDARG